jgi:putative phosphoesterase
MAMQVCVLSDTHGVLDPRVARLAAESDLVIHGGDVGNADVLRTLRHAGNEVLAVRGNNDVPEKWPTADHEELGTLPLALEVPVGTTVIAVEHGHRANPAGLRHQRLRERYPHARAVVYGHSHRLVCDTEEQPWILNPGAAGRSRTFGGPSCLLLTIGVRGHWRVETHRFAPTRRDSARGPAA